MKVYGWQGWRLECRAAPNGGRQTREVCAAKSVAAAARSAGVSSPSKLFNICETGNALEIATAMKEPGAVFWRALNDYKGEYVRASSNTPVREEGGQ